MSGGIQNRDYRELTAGIACGAILVAGLAVTSHRHRAAKVIGASLVATSLGPSTRAPEPSLALAPLPTARFHPAKLAQAPNSVSSAPPATAVSSPAISPKSRVQALKIYAALPMMFEANDGQTDSRVRFLARAPDYSLFLTNTEAVLSLPLGSPVARPAQTSHLSAGSAVPHLQESGRPKLKRVVRLKFAGASTPAAITGRDQLPGMTNYFIGDDPKQWHTNVPNYASVEYRGIYSGVDAVFHGDNRRLEFDFDVAPGVDPRVIALEVQGARPLRLNSAGDVLLRMDGKRDVLLGKPRVYQQSPEGRRDIEAHYVLGARNRIAFALGPYDHSQPLVIDPTLAYSTYLGGSQEDIPYAIAADSSGSAYITGGAYSADFPVSTGAYQTSCTTTASATCTSQTAFVTKLSPDGSSLVYSTFLNGTGGDIGYSIAVDSLGDALVTGLEAGELDFPTTQGALQTTCNTASNKQNEVFVAKLNPTGSGLVYSTCLQNPTPNAFSGTQGETLPGGIAVDASGNAYVTGSTSDPQGFPTTQGTFQSTCVLDLPSAACGVEQDPFVVKLDPTGKTLLYGTFLTQGKPGSSVSPGGIAVDSLGNAYVIGGSDGYSVITTPGSFIPSCPGQNCNGFVLKINGNATALVYSTWLVGTNKSNPTAVAVDQNGLAYVTGWTSATDFPTTVGALQYYFTPPGAATANLTDGFVVKVGALGDTFSYSTFLAGTSEDTEPLGIAVDLAGNALITGYTLTGFPTTPDAYQTSIPQTASSAQAFFCKLDPGGASLLYSTFLAGTSGEIFVANALGDPDIAVDASGNAYLTGETDSTSFPTTAGAFQTTLPSTLGSQYASGFIAKFSFSQSTLLAISPVTISSGTVGVPYGPVALTATGGTGAVTFAVTVGSLPSGLTFSSAGVLSGTPTQAGAFPFTITAKDSVGNAGSQAYTLTIAAGCSTITVAPSTLASGTLGTVYPAVTFTKTGGVGAITFSETGALPTGMTFVAGVLSGTPTQSGSFPITITATDSNGCTGNVSVSLKVNSASAVSTTTTITSTSTSFDGFSLPTNIALVGTTQVSLSFTVKPASGSATPTGTVTVTDGFNDTCSGTLTSTSAGAGSCALTISQVGSGSTSLTAAYTPDSSASSNGLLASASSAVTENVVQIVSCGVPPAATTVSEGATTTISFTVCLAGDVNAVPTAVTSNCLSNATCTLTVTAVPGKAGAYTVTLNIVTTAGSVPVQDPQPRSGPWPVVLFALSMLLLLWMAFLLSRHRGGRLRVAYSAGLVLALVLAGISGCTSASMSGPPNNTGTPVGNFTINVVVAAGNFTLKVPVSVTVTK